MTLQNRINPQGLFNEKVCESALFHQKNESYPQRGAENAQKDAVASKVYLTFDATAPYFLTRYWRFTAYYLSIIADIPIGINPTTPNTTYPENIPAISI